MALGILFLLHGAMGPVVAMADGGTAPVTGAGNLDPAAQAALVKTLPYADERQYQSCGLSCAYEKANEALSLEALYLLRKASWINELAKKKDAGEISRAIPEFCPSSDSNVLECARQYVELQKTILRKSRHAMIQNSESVARLKAGTAAPAPPRFSVIVSGNGNTPAAMKKPQTPDLPSYDELMTRAKRQDAILNDLARPDYNSFEQLYAPSPDDYVEVDDRIPRDPANPSAGTLIRVKVDAKGLPVLKKGWEQELTAAQKKFEEQKRFLRERLSGVAAAHAPPVPGAKPAATAPVSREPTELSRKAYETERDYIARAANEQLKKSGMVVQGTGASEALPKSSSDSLTRVGLDSNAVSPDSGRPLPVRLHETRRLPEHQRNFITIQISPDMLSDQEIDAFIR